MLSDAGLSAAEIGHVNANGLSTLHDDQIEAQAIHDLLGDVPVTAPKSFFGNLGAGTGAVEMAVSVLALRDGLVPHTLNYEHPDPLCPVNVIRCAPMKVSKSGGPGAQPRRLGPGGRPAAGTTLIRDVGQRSGLP